MQNRDATALHRNAELSFLFDRKNRIESLGCSV
jgi:hypothetical protein